MEQLDQIHPGGHPFTGAPAVRLQDALTDIRAKLVAVQGRVVVWENRYRAMSQALTDALVNLDAANAHLLEEKRLLREQAKSYYMTGAWQKSLAVMSSGNVEDAGRATVYLASVLGTDINAIARYKMAVRIAAVATLDAMSWSSRMLRLKSDIAAERTRLLATQRQITSLISGVVTTYDAGAFVFSSVIGHAQRGESAAPDTNRAVFRPVSGRITSPFGWRIHPVYHYRSFHTGIDLAASMGTPIHAPRDGVVIASAFAGPFGLTTVIDHGGRLATVMAHQSASIVVPGARVKAGQVIGFVGCTGWCTGPHVHFEVWFGGVVQNPILYADTAPQAFYAAQ